MWKAKIVCLNIVELPMWKREDGSENMVDFLDLVGDVEHQMATIMWWFTHVQNRPLLNWCKMERPTSDERLSIFRENPYDCAKIYRLLQFYRDMISKNICVHRNMCNSVHYCHYWMILNGCSAANDRKLKICLIGTLYGMTNTNEDITSRKSMAQ